MTEIGTNQERTAWDRNSSEARALENAGREPEYWRRHGLPRPLPGGWGRFRSHQRLEAYAAGASVAEIAHMEHVRPETVMSDLRNAAWSLAYYLSLHGPSILDRPAPAPGEVAHTADDRFTFVLSRRQIETLRAALDADIAATVGGSPGITAQPSSRKPCRSRRASPPHISKGWVMAWHESLALVVITVAFLVYVYLLMTRDG